MYKYVYITQRKDFVIWENIYLPIVIRVFEKKIQWTQIIKKKLF